MKERLGVRAGAGALLIFVGVLVSELLGKIAQPDLEPGKEPGQAGSAG